MTPTQEELLLDVHVRAGIADAAKTALDDSVVRARDGGVSWQRIADAVGIARPSAMERFKKVIANTR